MSNEAQYARAQAAIASLKAAILEILPEKSEEGMQNAEIGRGLGIHGGHKGHKGHISRTLLRMMKEEEVVEQDEETKRWRKAF